MALYHFSMSQIKRSQGRSVVAAAAYRAGEKLVSEYYGEVSDFTHKGGVVHSEILLPAHAPPEYADRGTLWNAVEKVEKKKNAQLAHSFDIALQTEFSFEGNLELVRNFLTENFISRGMIVDFSIHMPNNKNGIQNPHFHVLCPIRPLNPDGTWGQKQHKEIIQDDDGSTHTRFVSNTDWGDKETLLAWRRIWAEINNAKFEEKGLPQRIDYRSNEEQGNGMMPTIHEGPAVREMEARGVETNKGSLNRWIRKTNERLKKILARLAEIKEWFGKHREVIRENEDSLPTLIGEYYADRRRVSLARGYHKPSKKDREEEMKIMSYLTEHHLYSADQVTELVDELSDKIQTLRGRAAGSKKQSDRVEKIMDYINLYQIQQPVYREYSAIKFKKRREKFYLFYSEHAPELKQFNMARRKLKEMLGENFRIAPDTEHELNMRLIELKNECQVISAEIASLASEWTVLREIQIKADRALVLREETLEQQKARLELDTKRQVIHDR